MNEDRKIERLSQLKTQVFHITDALERMNESNWAQRFLVWVSDTKFSNTENINYVRDNFDSCKLCAAGHLSYSYALSNKVAFMYAQIDKVWVKFNDNTNFIQDFIFVMGFSLPVFNDSYGYEFTRFNLELYLEYVELVIFELEQELGGN